MSSTKELQLDEAYAADRAIALRLVRTWEPFFGRFGRLRDVQRQVIPRILDGADVLVCAPTAAGKTEAACAPLVERHIERAGAPWTVLYVSPTRALVNDLYARLCPPLERLGLRAVRRTGDHKDPIGVLPHVLITTPESFDSLLCRGRRKDELGHALAHVAAVVLDEIHLLHASARGEQIRWLLERLRRLRAYGVSEGWSRSDHVQVVGLSATVPKPESVVEAYLPSGMLIRVNGAREIETIDVNALSPAIEHMLPRYLEERIEPEKLLVFSNARKRVDVLAVAMRPILEQLGYCVRAHHGSLALQEREATESAIKKERKIVVFTTSTLEIGVDIGDIDVVVLDGPAPDVSAFLQRIGRGNRRSERTRVMLCAGSEAEVLIQSAMLEAARVAYLGPLERGSFYAVARQQAASFIFQSPKRARSRASIQQLHAALLPDRPGAVLLDHLVSIDELVEDREGLRLGADWAEAALRGEIHGNIESSAGQSVVDHATGDQIAVGVRFNGGPRLAIAGNMLDVRAWRDRKIEVRRSTDPHAPLGKWSYESKAWVSGAGQPQTVRRYLGLDEDEWPVLRTDHARAIVFHFGGGRLAALLKLLASRAAAAQLVRVNPWTVTIPSNDGVRPDWLVEAGPATIDLLVAAQLDTLEGSLALPNANRHLPLEYRLDEVRRWLAIDEQIGRIRSARWVKPSDEVREALLAIHRGL